MSDGRGGDTGSLSRPSYSIRGFFDSLLLRRDEFESSSVSGVGDGAGVGGRVGDGDGAGIGDGAWVGSGDDNDDDDDVTGVGTFLKK